MDAADFKAGLARFGTGVTVITTRDGKGEPAGFTASSFTSLSIDPPMVLFCLANDATCYDAFLEARCFAVNILSDTQQEISNRFASRGEDKFDGLTLRDGTEGMPLIENSLAMLECRTTRTVPGGDHLIFMGEVREIHMGEGRPLLYYMGGYHSI